MELEGHGERETEQTSSQEVISENKALPQALLFIPHHDPPLHLLPDYLTRTFFFFKLHLSAFLLHEQPAWTAPFSN